MCAEREGGRGERRLAGGVQRPGPQRRYAVAERHGFAAGGGNRVAADRHGSRKGDRLPQYRRIHRWGYGSRSRLALARVVERLNFKRTEGAVEQFNFVNLAVEVRRLHHGVCSD